MSEVDFVYQDIFDASVEEVYFSLQNGEPREMIVSKMERRVDPNHVSIAWAVTNCIIDQLESGKGLGELDNTFVNYVISL